MARIRFRMIDFFIENVVEPYNEDFFARINSHSWEPDVIGFLENNLSSDTLFVDIGASTGALTLMAASLQSRVIAYEPMQEEFEALSKNVSLNKTLISKIELRNCGIGVTSIQLPLEGKQIGIRNQQMISEINYKSGGRKNQVIEIRDSKSEARTWVNSSRIVIKMDIEGAEYPLLQDKLFLFELSRLNATCLIALHPGAMRPHKKILPVLDRIRYEMFKYKNFRESINLFQLLQHHCEIRMLDNSSISSSHRFARLVNAGLLTFTLHFRHITVES